MHAHSGVLSSQERLHDFELAAVRSDTAGFFFGGLIHGAPYLDHGLDTHSWISVTEERRNEMIPTFSTIKQKKLQHISATNGLKRRMTNLLAYAIWSPAVWRGTG